MKVSIPVRKTVTETVELPQLPYYSCRYSALFYMIAEDQTVVYVANRQIAYWPPNDTYYADNLVEAYQAEPCTKEEFDNAVAATMSRITAVLNPAKGAVTNTMQTDPNLKAEEQATQASEGQINATESTAQDAAVGAEESTEG